MNKIYIVFLLCLVVLVLMISNGITMEDIVNYPSVFLGEQENNITSATIPGDKSIATQAPVPSVNVATPTPYIDCNEAEGWVRNEATGGCYRINEPALVPAPTSTPLPGVQVPTIQDLNDLLEPVQVDPAPTP